MLPAVARRQRENGNGQPLYGKMHTGACGPGCGCVGCPTGASDRSTIGDIATLLGRTVAGVTGRCKYNFIHLTNANKAGIAAAGVETLTENVQFGLCIQQIVVVAREVATPLVSGSFSLTNLMLGNKPQWLLNRPYHSALFTFDSECSCCLPGDCTTVGTLASVTVTNTGANLTNIDVYLIGPAVG